MRDMRGALDRVRAEQKPYRVDAEEFDADLPADVHAAGRAVADFIAAIDAAQ
jgi:hypothetical protein